MKKAIIMIITMFIIIPTNVMALTNKNGVIISDSEYENLKSMGFSETEIKLMPEEIFLENKDLKGEIIATSTKYYKGVYNNRYSTLNINKKNDNYINVEITEKEYNNYNDGNSSEFYIMNNPSTAEAPGGIKKLTTRIIKVGSNYRVRNDLTWKKMPKFRDYDLIGIRINNAVVEPKSGTGRAYTTYEIFDECEQVELSNLIDSEGGQTSPYGQVYTVALPSDKTRSIYYQAPYGNWPCKAKKPTTSGTKTLNI